MNQIRSFFKSRSFRIGMYSAISSVIVIAIAVGIIMITDKLPATYTKIDMTKNQLYSISEQTEKIVRGSMRVLRCISLLRVETRTVRFSIC